MPHSSSLSEPSQAASTPAVALLSEVFAELEKVLDHHDEASARAFYAVKDKYTTAAAQA